LLAVVLMAVFTAPSVSLLCAASENAVPACCRRDGKHRCMMSMRGMLLGDTRPSFRDALPDCPYRSHLSRITGTQGAPLMQGTALRLSSDGDVTLERPAALLPAPGNFTPTRGPPAPNHGLTT